MQLDLTSTGPDLWKSQTWHVELSENRLFNKTLRTNHKEALLDLTIIPIDNLFRSLIIVDPVALHEVAVFLYIKNPDNYY